jgi:hypothetical protein
LKLKVKIINIISDFKVAGSKVVIPHDNAAEKNQRKKETQQEALELYLSFRNKDYGWVSSMINSPRSKNGLRYKI